MFLRFRTSNISRVIHVEYQRAITGMRIVILLLSIRDICQCSSEFMTPVNTWIGSSYIYKRRFVYPNFLEQCYYFLVKNLEDVVV